MPFQYVAEMIEEVRSEIDEPVAASISDTFILRALNNAQNIVGRDV